jgi:serine/threonine-protein kinase
MAAQAACPDVEWWHDLLDGSLSVREQEGLSKHLDTCSDCQRTMERLTATGSWPADSIDPDQEAHSPDPALRRVIDDLKTQGSCPGLTPDPGSTATDELSYLRPARRPGQLGRLGSYDVLAVIGRGGMGIVYKAFDPALARLVAIKVLAPQWASSPAARQRFAREARATAAVRHDQVIAVYAVEEAEGVPYLVMEFVHGISLQQHLDRNGPLEVEEVVQIGAQAAAGLAAAHARGLIHRDVKPANILLAHGSGRVKLSDFGLARAIDDASMTQSGVIAGTPMYMAPEQARGGSLDHRADLFSLGSVLYALCTGRPPFRGDSTLAVLRCVCEDTPPSIRDLNPVVPGWLEEIIDTLLAKDPAERLQSAAEVAELLEAHLAHLQDPTHVPCPARLGRRKRRPMRRRILWLGAAIGLCLTAVAVWLALHGWPFGAGRETGGPAQQEGTSRQAGSFPVTLEQGRMLSGRGLGVSFQVNYRFAGEGPDTKLRYLWVIRTARRQVFERPVSAMELRQSGTLQGGSLFRPLVTEGPLETFLAVERLVPGHAGWQRERVSNVEIITPTAVQGLRPGWRFP